MKHLKFPNGIERIIVLGARPLSVALVRFAQQRGIRLEVFTGPRQKSICLPDGTALHESLATMGCQVNFVDDLRRCENGPYHSPDDRTLLWSFACPYPIDQDLFQAYEGRIINLHAALLPEWRGGGGFSWAILSGERDGGGTFHQLTPNQSLEREMHGDEGPVVRRFGFRYPDHLRVPSEYENYFDEVAAAPLLELLDDLCAGKTMKLLEQAENKSRFLPRLSTVEQGFIDWNWPGESVQRCILAFSHPYPGATTFVRQGCPVRIFDAEFEPHDELQHPFINGIVYRVADGVAWVNCSGGHLRVRTKDIQSEVELIAGDRLYTPMQNLELARSAMPKFSARGRVGGRP